MTLLLWQRWPPWSWYVSGVILECNDRAVMLDPHSQYDTATMANGPLWDSKVHKQAKFGDPFDGIR